MGSVRIRAGCPVPNHYWRRNSRNEMCIRDRLDICSVPNHLEMLHPSAELMASKSKKEKGHRRDEQDYIADGLNRDMV